MKKSYLKIQLKIDTEIDYLDASIRCLYDGDNEDDLAIEAQINHQSNAEPHALPYIDNHSYNNYEKLFRAALIRAARCCLDIYDFQQERQYIELSFALNHFSPDFIREQVSIFFLEFDFEEYHHFSYDNDSYEQLRQNVIQYHRKTIQARNKRRRRQRHRANSKFVSKSMKRFFYE